MVGRYFSKKVLSLHKLITFTYKCREKIYHPNDPIKIELGNYCNINQIFNLKFLKFSVLKALKLITLS